MKRISLFDSKNEWINILAGISFLVIVLVAIFLNVPQWSGMKASKYYWVAAIWGTGHTVLTLFLVSFISKRRDRDFYRKSPFFWIFFAVLFILVLVAVVLSMFLSKGSICLMVAELILLITFEQHALGQIRGLSLMYNQQTKLRNILSLQQLRLIEKLEYLEKKIFFLLAAMWICFYLIKKTMPLHVSLQWWFLLWLPVIFILLISFLYPLALRSNKTFFLLRLILFPLGIHSQFAFLAIFFLHGLEYQQVVLRIFQNDRQIKWYLGSFSAILLVLVAFTLAHRIEIFFPSHSGFIVVSIVLVTQLIDYSHYVFDAIIFRKKTFASDLKFI